LFYFAAGRALFHLLKAFLPADENKFILLCTLCLCGENIRPGGKRMKTKLVIIIVTVLFVFSSVNAFAGGRWHHFYNKKNEIMQKICDRWQSRFCDSVEPEPATEPEPEPEPATTATAPALKVFSADGQDLGILVFWNAKYVQTFVPSLNRIVTIWKSDGEARGLYNFTLYFEDPDCRDQPYFLNAELSDFINYNAYNGLLPEYYQYQYFSVDQSAEVITPAYYYNQYSKTCEPTNLSETVGYKMIEIPEENIPFTLPASVPLQLKYE
jgi:hypothetical protein